MRKRLVVCSGCPFNADRTGPEIPDDVMAEVRRRIDSGEQWVCHQTCDGPRVTERSSLCAASDGLMALARFKAQNHPQQLSRRWPDDVDGVDDRATHPLHFAEFEDEWGPFTIDVAAAAHNTKCARFYDRDADGLAQSWAGETVWCNPPYSDIAPWVRKAWDEHVDATRIVMLLPANRTEQQWWQLMVEPFRDRASSPLSTRFLPGRMRFLKPGQTAVGPNERPPFGCVLLVWRPAEHELVYDPNEVRGGLFG